MEGGGRGRGNLGTYFLLSYIMYEGIRFDGLCTHISSGTCTYAIVLSYCSISRQLTPCSSTCIIEFFLLHIIVDTHK